MQPSKNTDITETLTRYSIALSLANNTRNSASPCYLDADLRAQQSPERKARDSLVLAVVVRAIEQSLVDVGQSIPQATVQKLQTGIETFVESSSEFSLRSRFYVFKDGAAAFSIDYLFDALFKAFLKKQAPIPIHSAVLNRVTKIQDLLNINWRKLTTDDLVALHTVKQALFLPKAAMITTLKWVTLEQLWLESQSEHDSRVRAICQKLPAARIISLSTNVYAAEYLQNFCTHEESAIEVRLTAVEEKIGRFEPCQDEIQKITCDLLKMRRKDSSNNEIVDCLLSSCRVNEVAFACEKARRKINDILQVLNGLQAHLETSGHRASEDWAIQSLSATQALRRYQDTLEPILEFFRGRFKTLDQLIGSQGFTDKTLTLFDQWQLGSAKLASLYPLFEQFARQTLQQQQQEHIRLYREVNTVLSNALGQRKNAALTERFSAFTFSLVHTDKPDGKKVWKKISLLNFNELFDKLQRTLIKPYVVKVDALINAEKPL